MGAGLAITAAGQLFGGAVGASKFFEGRKQQRKAQKAIENFEFSKLENPYEGMAVSTMGSDYVAEEAAGASANAVDALQNAGSRALAGGAGRVQQENNRMLRESGVDLDSQVRENQRLEAAGASEVQKLKDTREREELAGLGAQLNQGSTMKQQGLGNITTSLADIGAFVDENFPPK